MAKGPLHIIHKQVIEISTGNLKDAHEIERRYRELVKQINSPSFENCFDDLLAPDQHLVIDRLEINLGDLNKNTLFNELGIHLSHALREAILKNISQKPFEFQKRDNIGQTLGSKNTKIPSSGNVPGISSDTNSLHHGPFEIFTFFLEKGRLPNWVSIDYKFEEDWVVTLDTQQLVLLKKLIQNSEQALLRLASHFPVSFLLKIIENFESAITIFDNWNWIDSRLLHTSAEKLLFKKIYWSYAISRHFSSVPETPVSAKEKEKEILFKALQKLPDKLLVSMKGLLLGKDIPEPFQKRLQNSLNRIISENQSEKGYSEQGKSNFNSLSPFEDLIFPHKPTAEKDPGASLPSPEFLAEKRRKRAKALREDLLTNEEPIWVNDAGLVLLSPFFTELFQTCDFLDKGNFKSIEMSARAVNLLVYLAHGMEELAEYQKLLPKLFCGILWETLLPETLPVSDQERYNADELLLAVVKHWKALGNSSPEAIQEAFIRRPGKLVPGNPGIILEVEQKTQDVLLKHLPWGFSMIKFQWMSDIIQVKWI